MEEDNMRRPPANDAQYIALLSGDAWLEIGQLPDAMTRGIWERERERCPLCSACTKPASVRIEKEHFSPFRTQRSKRCLSLDFSACVNCQCVSSCQEMPRGTQPQVQTRLRRRQKKRTVARRNRLRQRGKWNSVYRLVRAWALRPRFSSAYSPAVHWPHGSIASHNGTRPG